MYHPLLCCPVFAVLLVVVAYVPLLASRCTLGRSSTSGHLVCSAVGWRFVAYSVSSAIGLERCWWHTGTSSFHVVDLSWLAFSSTLGVVS